MPSGRSELNTPIQCKPSVCDYYFSDIARPLFERRFEIRKRLFQKPSSVRPTDVSRRHVMLYVVTHRFRDRK